MINITNVTKSFQGLFRPVIDEISLYLECGGFCVLIGANGCGKSTLLKLISGEHKADSGEIKLSADVAQVVQDVNLGTVPEMTLLQNIALSEVRVPKLLFYRRYRDQVIQKLQELDIGLEQYIDQPLKMLSGGQRQMIATLMAINSGRQILLLDEPTGDLDSKNTDNVLKILLELNMRNGITLIMVTHDVNLKYFSNRVLRVLDGKIIKE